MVQYVSSAILSGRYTSHTVSEQDIGAGPNGAIQRIIDLN